MTFKTNIDISGIFNDIFENSSENAIIIMGKDGKIFEVNNAFCNKFGYTADDVTGKHFEIFFTEEDRSRGLPEQELSRVKEKGFAEDHNYLVNKNDTRTWVSGESILVKNKSGEEFLIKIIQNIHKIKDLQHTLQKEHEFSENILMSIDDAIVVLDTDYNIYKTNDAFQKLFDWNNNKISGFNLLKEKPFTDRLDRLMNTGEETAIELKHKDKVFNVKFNTLHEYYIPQRFLITLTDITARVESDQKKDDMIAFVTHELRNPLSSISMCNDLLEDSIREKNYVEAASFLVREKQNLERLKILISELHEATKAGTGNLQFVNARFNFRKIVYECIETELYMHKDYTIICKNTEDIELTGDSYRIAQVITNFLTNAIKYSDPPATIEVDYNLDKNKLIFSVKDFGRGIPENEKDIIFERYYRSPKTKNTEGLGLGLYLSKEIIETHSGKVWVESKEGKGSVFYFSLPVT